MLSRSKLLHETLKIIATLLERLFRTMPRKTESDLNQIVEKKREGSICTPNIYDIMQGSMDINPFALGRINDSMNFLANLK